MRSPRSSTACSPRRTTASAGHGTGSTWPATARTRPTPSSARLYPNGFRYRDWVVKALNDDMPYDRFVTEQIAGDLIDGPEREERLAALGFFAPGAASTTARPIADELDDRVDTLCRGMLGLTVACARCHDHKFDPIPTKDYYSLAGHLHQHASTRNIRSPTPKTAADFEQCARPSSRPRPMKSPRSCKTESASLSAGA